MPGVKIDSGEWVVVCDGSKALILENAGDARFPNLRTREAYEHKHPATRELGSDVPGRAFASVGSTRSAVEQTDWHRQAEERFAAQVADLLYRMAHAHTFDHLVVIAAPKVLGNLRAAFHPEVATRVVAEVAKDLTSVPTHDLAKRLSLTPPGGIEPRQ